MHYFSIRARPRLRDRIEPGSRSARVDCWVSFPLREGALAVARHYLSEDGWSISSVDRHRVISSAKDVRAAERAHAREAERHGACFVYRRLGKERETPARTARRRVSARARARARAR